MKRTTPAWPRLLLAALALLPVPVHATIGLWSTPAELSTLPTTGPAWTAVQTRADQAQTAPDVANQDDPTNVRVLASAIVYARTGNATYKNKVTNAISILVNRGDPGGRSLAWGREVGAYVLAADLVDYQSHSGNAAFRTWIRNMAEVYICEQEGTNMLLMFKDRPNNWGTMAFGSLTCIYAYLQDTTKLNEIRDYWIDAVVGPNPGLVYSSPFTWHIDENNKRLYNPAGAVKSGVNIDGVMPDDMRRGGGFSNPPGFTGYAWEGQQGCVLAGRVFERIGMSIWDVGDLAIYRGAYRLQVGWATAYDPNWKAQGDDAWMLPFIDSAYGTNLTSTSSESTIWDAGKNTGFAYVTLADGSAPAQVAAPAFNPGGGTYSSAQSVTITTATSGASIRYTTNGTTPTSTTGTVYAGPVSISSTTTLKAIAYKSGMIDSSVTSATYTINLSQVAPPVFNPGGGTYASAQSVAITSATSGASIRYTTNGTTPTSTSGTLYSGPVSVASSLTLKAIAYKSGMLDSTVTSANYSINGGGSPAKFSIAGANVTASAHDGNVPANTVDNNLSTRWSAEGDGQWIRYDLGASGTVSYVKIAWYLGNTRQSFFDVQVSNDGTNWTNVLTNVSSSGTTTALETYDFADVSPARYVRIVGHGNSNSLWNSIAETEVWGIADGGGGGGGGGTFNLTATADSFVQGGTSASTNFNSTTYLRVKNASGDSNDRWTYIKFNLGTVTGTVQSATLKLKLKALTNGSPAAAHIHSVSNDSWSETGLTWNNKPAVGSVLASNTSLTTVDTVYNFTITSFVAGENTGDRIVTIAIQDDNQVAKAADFYRREDGTADAPTLTVVTQ